MNPCEQILKNMNPSIRAYHSDKWLKDDRPIDAETLYLRYLEKYAKHIDDLRFIIEVRQENQK